MDYQTKQALISHIEPYVKELDTINEVGAYVDIPMLDYVWIDFMSVISLCCMRYIREPRGNVNSTWQQTEKARYGHLRITLQVQR